MPKIVPLPTAQAPAEQPKERFSRRKDGLYQLELRYTLPDGSKKKKSFYGKTQAEAIEKRDDFRHKLRTGLDVERQGTTVECWAAQWLTVFKDNVKPNTKKKYEHDVSYILGFIGKKKMDSITLSDVQKIINSKKGMSSSTIHKLHITMKSLFETARAERLIVFNPCDNVKLPESSEGTHRVVSSEVRELITSSWKGHRFGRAAMLMLYAGLRRGEVIAFDLHKDVDLKNMVIHVRQAIWFDGNTPIVGSTKTAAGVRKIPIMPQLVEVLRGASGYAATSAKGALLTETGLQRVIESYVIYLERIINGKTWLSATPEEREAWKRVPLRCHDLRHTYCSMLYDAGVSVKTTQLWMGHKDVSVTMKIYTHLSQEKNDTDRDAAYTHFKQMSVNVSVNEGEKSGGSVDL